MGLKDQNEIKGILEQYQNLKSQTPAQQLEKTLSGVSGLSTPPPSYSALNLPPLIHNKVLFDIFDGNLLPYVLQALRSQFSAESYAQIVDRVAPINVLRKLVAKLSTIYSPAPVRTPKTENEKDKELVGWYMEQLDPNTAMNEANGFFNLHKSCFIEPYVECGFPRLRVVPSDRAFAYSNDPINPARMTHYVKIMGSVQIGKEKRAVLYVFTDDEFTVISDSGDKLSDIQSSIRNTDGINEYGKIPAIYLNRSRHDIVPQIDSDTLAMTLLIPILLSDLNYAVKFQAFSMIYGIDIDAENIKIGPNVFLDLKSKGGGVGEEKKPEIGTIKPTVDIPQVMELIRGELSMWMQTRNIKPGSMGKLTVDDASSGVAKIIDEMDTSEDRQKQVPYFVRAEKDLFDLIFNHMHKVWIEDDSLDFQNKQAFSETQEIRIEFEDQKPSIDPGQLIDNEIKKLNAGLTTKERAVRAINPDLSDEEIESFLEELEEADQEAPDAMDPNADPKGAQDDGQGMMDDSEMEMGAKGDGKKAPPMQGKKPMGKGKTKAEAMA